MILRPFPAVVRHPYSSAAVAGVGGRSGLRAVKKDVKEPAF